jgi:hypothetical protein
MKYHFCTLFDRNYVARGVALHRSLLAHVDDFTLSAFCMDDEAYATLSELQLPNVRPFSLGELEDADPGLAAVRSSRSHVEYMWTATPAICLAALAYDGDCPAITYLDADLFLFSDTRPVFDEIGESSVAIVPHRHSPRWEHYAAITGIYNVGWLTFRRDDNGLAALTWWRERCLEWCKGQPEDGKYGDQAYLDDWPTRFDSVHVIEHVGAGLGPWNVENHELSADGGTVLVDGLPLVYYHFHALRLVRPGPLTRLGASVGFYRRTGAMYWRPAHRVSARENELIWDGYLRELDLAYALLERHTPAHPVTLEQPYVRELASLAGRAAWTARSRSRRSAT